MESLKNVTTHAGVAKMLARRTNKLCTKALKETMYCGSMTGLQTRKMKEHFFVNIVQKNVEEKTKPFKSKSHLGKDPMSDQIRWQILNKRVLLQHEYMEKMEVTQKEGEFSGKKAKLYSRRLLHETGRTPDGPPSFHLYSSFNLEFKLRTVTLFQQAARKVLMQCRANQRLVGFKKPAQTVPLPPKVEKEEKEEKTPRRKRKERKVTVSKITADKITPFSFPSFCTPVDPLSPKNMRALRVEPIDPSVTPRVPYLKPEIPQHYKVMGYQPVSALHAYNSYIPTALARPLRTGPLGIVEDPLKAKLGEEHHPESVESGVNVKLYVNLSFTAPEALLGPIPANPLRIFNPTPGLQTYKPAPKYMESDIEAHVCPLSNYTVPESTMHATRTQIVQRKLIDHREVLNGIMMWKNFDSLFLKCFSEQPSLTDDSVLCRTVDYNRDILPVSHPRPLLGLPGYKTARTDVEREGSRIKLTPEMIRAEFLSSGAFAVS